MTNLSAVARCPFDAPLPGGRERALAALAGEGPVQRVRLPGGQQVWLVLGRTAARAALADPRLVKTTHVAGEVALRRAPEAYAAVRNHLLMRDGAAHARLRRLAAGAFTVRRVQSLLPRIEAAAQDLIDGFAGEREVDLVRAYALPLPMTVICDLVGVPHPLRGPLRKTAAVMVAGVFTDEDTYLDAVVEHAALVRELVALKRAEPADDLLSALVAARDGTDRLSEDELTSVLSLLVVAGHETTAHLIGNAVHLLLTHPDQLAAVRADPGLLPDVVEEALRHSAPVHVALPLEATEPLDLAGVRIAAGEVVYVDLLAANRDPAHVPDGDRFDVARPYAPHLAFGHGVHHCLGAPLARLEARIALAALLGRFPRLALAVPPEELRRHPSMLVHGLQALPLRLG